MADVTLSEVKAAIEAEARLNEEFRKTNEARLKALETTGRRDPLFDEKLDKINDAMSDLEKIQREYRKQQEMIEKRREAEETERRKLEDEWIRKVESKVNRSLLGLGGTEDIEEHSKKTVERKAFGNFLRKGVEKMAPDEVKVLTVSNDTTGGYLAPPAYVQEIIKGVVLYSPVRSIVNVRSVGTTEYQQPKRTTTAAATWATETASRAETTNPAWGLVKIPVHECYAEARISWANLEDSAFNLEQLLADEFGEQFGVSEGTAVVSGTGVGKPAGFMDSSSGVSYTASGAASTIASVADGSAGQANGMINLYHAVATAYARQGTWVLNRASLGKVRLLKDTTGTYIWQPSLQVGNPGTILGSPYVECPDMPDEGSNTYPIAFGDFRRAYTLVDRIEMVMTRDPYTVASSGQVKFFARRRVGGQVVLSEAIRWLKCATS